MTISDYIRKANYIENLKTFKDENDLSEIEVSNITTEIKEQTNILTNLSKPKN